MVAKKNYKKRPAAKRRAWKGRKPHISRSLNDQKQYSSIVESVSYDASILANVPTNWTIGLGNLTRARLMARCFQFFRIDEVSYKYTPRYNLFGEQAATSDSIPYAYRIMDRGNELTTGQINVEVMKSMGARPMQFTKPVTVKYRPNTLSVADAAVTSPTAVLLQANSPAYGQWFPCNTERGAIAGAENQNTFSSQSITHYGHWFYVLQSNPLAGAGLFTCDITVRVSFKNPMAYIPPSGFEDVFLPATPVAVRIGVRNTTELPVVGDVEIP